MKRIIVALGVCVFAAMLAGPAWAGGFHGGSRSGGVRVFIGHGRPFFHDRFFVGHRSFVHRPFFDRKIIVDREVVVVPRFRSAVIVKEPFVFFGPFPRQVWVPGFWQWDGLRWIWVPGHWS